jgi:spore coat polysaccharide biosynthesis protein SpsF (cytidylyltransferase family)
MATYDSTSPYFQTGYSQFFLDVMVNRPIPKLTDDIAFKINQTYQYRPDLLAFDLYENPNLWWVFYQRNPNTLQKPPLDFKADTLIYLPKITTLKNTLGF